MNKNEEQVRAEEVFRALGIEDVRSTKVQSGIHQPAQFITVGAVPSMGAWKEGRQSAYLEARADTEGNYTVDMSYRFKLGELRHAVGRGRNLAGAVLAAAQQISNNIVKEHSALCAAGGDLIDMLKNEETETGC
jgi:hypothetical protein